MRAKPRWTSTNDSGRGYLQGPIGCSDPLNIHSCREVIDEAFQGTNLEAVILNINSCGGSLTQSHLVSTYIQAGLK